MDKKFLNKVVGQIVSETTIDYRGRGKIFTPFTTFTFPSLYIYYYRSNFTKHCKEVYGLNEQEIEYI